VANHTARRFAILFVLLSLASLPMTAEPLRSRPARPATAFSEVVAGLAEKLLSLWRRTDEAKPAQPSATNKEAASDCRSMIDPWGCPDS
jgi:hypothetical protein